METDSIIINKTKIETFVVTFFIILFLLSQVFNQQKVFPNFPNIAFFFITTFIITWIVYSWIVKKLTL